METLTHLLGTGDPCSLVLAIAGFAIGGLLIVVAVRTKPRRWRSR